MKKVLMYLWQLPQNLCGLVYSLFHKGALIKEYEDAVVYRSSKMYGGVSLGKYLFVNKYASMKTVKHEYGHYRQSKYLGWLYLLVIGLPSIVWCTLHMCGCFRNKPYEWFYTEKWADSLGGVNK